MQFEETINVPFVAGTMYMYMYCDLHKISRKNIHVVKYLIFNFVETAIKSYL